MESFNNYNFKPTIQQALGDLGFVKPTEIQHQVFSHLVENPQQDFHGQAQTGTGKTLAFGLPLLQSIDSNERAVQGLIVAPTRELVLQICESLQSVARHTGIVIHSVYGGVSIVKQIRDLRGSAHIVVGTPGRIIDHLERKTLSLNKVRIVVLDEADIMLDMGFRQEIDTILTHVAPERSLWLFSATVKESVREVKDRYMRNVISVQTKAQQPSAALTRQYYCLVSRKDRLRALARFLDVEQSFYGIIFCSTKLQCAEVAQELTKRGYTALALHGDMDQPLRTHVIDGFKDKKNTILVATDVAARGIDVPDLTHVINYSVPEDHEGYVHRVGRTGRAGKQGTAITFVGRTEQNRLRTIARRFNINVEQLEIPNDERVATARVESLFRRSKQDTTKTSGVCAGFIKSLLAQRSQEELIEGLVHVLCDEVTQDMPKEDVARFDDGYSRSDRGGRGGRERRDRDGGGRRGDRPERFSRGSSFGGGRRDRDGGYERPNRGDREGGREGSFERPNRGDRGGYAGRPDREGGYAGRAERDGGRSGNGYERNFERGPGRERVDRTDRGPQVMLTVGSEDNVTKQDILQTIQQSGAELRSLGSIRVIARRTFISAEPEVCVALAKTLDGATIGSRRVRAKVE